MNNLTSLTMCFDDGDDDDFAVGATKKITRQEIASLNAPSIVECRRGVDGRRVTRPADRDFKREAERYKKFCLKSINTRTDVKRRRRLSLFKQNTPRRSRRLSSNFRNNYYTFTDCCTTPTGNINSLRSIKGSAALYSRWH